MSGIPPQEVYLASDFDASTLKVAQLRGLLLQYAVPFPATGKKADLVQAFEDGIRPKASSILATASRVKPSNSGFISVADDGTETASVASTGQKRARGRPKKEKGAEVKEEVKEEADADDEVEPEVAPPIKKPRVSRPRKSSKSVDPEVVIPQTAPPKHRKTRRSTTADDEIIVEIEQHTTPAPRTGRGKPSVPLESPAPSVPSLASAPPSSRRRSVNPSSVSVSSEIPAEPPSAKKKSLSKKKSESALNLNLMDEVKEVKEEEEEPKRRIKTPRRSAESGFSDFNPFQSGSEDAADQEKRRRKSSIGLSVRKPAQPRFSEPAKSPSHPSPPASVLRRVGPSRENLKTPPKEVRDAALAERQAIDRDTAKAEEYNSDIRSRLNQITSADKDQPAQVSVESHVGPSSSTTLTQRVKRVSDQIPHVSAPRSAIPLSILFLLLLSFIVNYKSQSASIGYCDAGSSVNDIVLHRQSALDNANACIARRTALDLDNPGAGKAVHCDVSALPLVPFLPRPTSCAPCPQHAICEDGKLIACEPEYLLASHPLTIISPTLDGLPGVGPKAFSPSCRPDTAKKRMIGGLAKSLESDLARGRGHVVCAGLGKEDGRKGLGERFGVEETTLRETYAARRDPKFSKEQFEEIFEAALKDLVEHDDVIESIDVEGRSWYAAARTELTLACTTKLHLIDLLEKWKSQLISTAVVISVIGYIRTTMRHRQAEKYRAEELVQVVLKRLQDQERLHYADPVTTPHPFIPPTQLRDVVMPPRGSTTSRTRLWQRVQDLVEANANVAVRDQEVKGELWKTWEWSGVGERHVTWE